MQPTSTKTNLNVSHKASPPRILLLQGGTHRCSFTFRRALILTSGSVARVTATITVILLNGCATSNDSHDKIGLGVGLGVPLPFAIALLCFESTKHIRTEGGCASIESATASTEGAGHAVTFADPKYEHGMSEIQVNLTEL